MCGLFRCLDLKRNMENDRSKGPTSDEVYGDIPAPVTTPRCSWCRDDYCSCLDIMEKRPHDYPELHKRKVVPGDPESGGD